MILRAPAKLNLALRVVGPAVEGFHPIETHFIRLRLADTVELVPGGEGIRLTVESDPGAEAPADEENLCWRAARLFGDAVGQSPDVAIGLRKTIPSAAGLGGGSSDAAAVLRGLAGAHATPLDEDSLLELAAALGSDVPFFASGAASAIGRGRGERLELLPAPPRRPVLILVPDFGVSAAHAYAWWAEDRASGLADRSPGGEAAPTDWSTIEARATNDLAAPVERRHPALREAREALVAAGASMALLCGSGSCVAGIFGNEAARAAAVSAAPLRRLAADRGWRTIETWTEEDGGHG